MQLLIAGETTLEYFPEATLIKIKGSMRLANLTEYAKVQEYLTNIAKLTEQLTIDMKELTFLNSSGITTISMFILNTKKIGKPTIKVFGAKNISWQEKSLGNFHKLWNEVVIEVF